MPGVVSRDDSRHRSLTPDTSSGDFARTSASGGEADCRAWENAHTEQLAMRRRRCGRRACERPARPFRLARRLGPVRDRPESEGGLAGPPLSPRLVTPRQWRSVYGPPQRSLAGKGSARLSVGRAVAGRWINNLFGYVGREKCAVVQPVGTCAAKASGRPSGSSKNAIHSSVPSEWRPIMCGALMNVTPLSARALCAAWMSPTRK